MYDLARSITTVTPSRKRLSRTYSNCRPLCAACRGIPGIVDWRAIEAWCSSFRNSPGTDNRVAIRSSDWQSHNKSIPRGSPRAVSAQIRRRNSGSIIHSIDSIRYATLLPDISKWTTQRPRYRPCWNRSISHTWPTRKRRISHRTPGSRERHKMIRLWGFVVSWSCLRCRLYRFDWDYLLKSVNKPNTNMSLSRGMTCKSEI